MANETSRPRVSLVLAIGENNAIGQGKALPWYLPADLKRFRALTWGHPILMGRKTHESIGRVLPGRRNLVITRNADYHASGAEVAHSLDEALALCAGEPEVFVIGGAELYRQALPLADRAYLTRVAAAPAADTYLDAIDWSAWREVSREHHAADAENPFACDFLVLDRALPSTPAPVAAA